MTEAASPPPAALVTGASSGLGAAVVRLLGADGWRVGGLDVRPVALRDLGAKVIGHRRSPRPEPAPAVLGPLGRSPR